MPKTPAPKPKRKPIVRGRTAEYVRRRAAVFELRSQGLTFPQIGDALGVTKKVIVTCVVTGSADTAGRNPAVPVTPEEIARSAIDAARAGAAPPARARPAAGDLQPRRGDDEFGRRPRRQRHDQRAAPSALHGRRHPRGRSPARARGVSTRATCGWPRIWWSAATSRRRVSSSSAWASNGARRRFRRRSAS